MRIKLIYVSNLEQMYILSAKRFDQCLVYNKPIYVWVKKKNQRSERHFRVEAT